MMRVTRYPDAAAILDAAADFFVEDELSTSVPYGLFNRLKRSPDLFGDPADHYYVLVTAAGTRSSALTVSECAEAAGRVVMLAMQVGRYALSFYLSSSATREERSEAMALLVRHLDECGYAKAVRKVEGQREYAVEMAAIWNSTAGRPDRPPIRVNMEAEFLVCDRVEVPSLVVQEDDPALQIITATEAHVGLLADWNVAFATSFGDAPPSPEESRKMAASWVDGRDGSKAYLLCAEAEGKRETVSLCLTNRESPNTRTISMVYTPIEFGGRGYATKLVASVTQRILAEKRYCCLFTDMSNPHSNHVYRKVGYRTHSHWDEYETVPEEQA